MRTTRLPLLALTVIVLLALAPAGEACAVCNGQSDHAMTEGAKLAVLLLGSVTYLLLTGVAILIATWVVRARRLARTPQDRPTVSDLG